MGHIQPNQSQNRDTLFLEVFVRDSEDEDFIKVIIAPLLLLSHQVVLTFEHGAELDSSMKAAFMMLLSAADKFDYSQID